MLTMIRYIFIIALSFLYTTAIIPGFDKDKNCLEPCNLSKPKVSPPKNITKTNVSPSQEIKKEKSSNINIHSSSNDLKEMLRKKVQPNYSEAHTIERIKIATREELNKSRDIKFNKKFLPSMQKIDNNMNGIMKKKEQEVEILEPLFNDTLKE